MAHIDVNLDEVEDQGEAHPEGEMLVRIAKAEIKHKKDDPSSRYVNWQLSPVESDNHRPLFLITSLKPDALWNLKTFLKAAGVQWNSDGSFDTEDAMGSELFVNVKIEEYEGTLRNRVGTPYRPA